MLKTSLDCRGRFVDPHIPYVILCGLEMCITAVAVSLLPRLLPALALNCVKLWYHVT